MTRAELENMFSDNQPKCEAYAKDIARLRTGAYRFAELLLGLTPPSREQESAIEKVKEAAFMGAQAILCHQNDPRREPR